MKYRPVPCSVTDSTSVVGICGRSRVLFHTCRYMHTRFVENPWTILFIDEYRRTSGGQFREPCLDTDFQEKRNRKAGRRLRLNSDAEQRWKRLAIVRLTKSELSRPMDFCLLNIVLCQNHDALLGKNIGLERSLYAGRTVSERMLLGTQLCIT